MGTTSSTDSIHHTREQKRLTASRLFQQGDLSDGEIARLLGAHASTVRSWHHTWTAGGPDALLGHANGGVKCALDPAQCQALRELLRRGAADYGFATDIWTLARIRQVIDERFSVAYTSLSGISHLLHRMGFTSQPAHRDVPGHDGGAIWEWVDTTWQDTHTQV